MGEPPAAEDDRAWHWSSSALFPSFAEEETRPAAAKPKPAAAKPVAKAPASARGLAKPSVTAPAKPAPAKPAPAPPSAPKEPKAAKAPSIIKLARAGEPARQFVKCALATAQNQVFALLQRLARQASLKAFTGGGPARHVRRLNLMRDDAPALLAILQTARNTHEFYAETVSGEILTMREFADSWPKWPASFSLLVLERSAVAAGFNQVHVSTIQIALWSLSESYSSDRLYQTDLPHSSFAKIREKTIRGLFDRGEDSDAEDAENVYDCRFPIDIVYTWVNDQDVAWQRRKDRVSLRHDRPANAGARAKLSERFRNRDELRFSFRSVEMFAPFVRKIFLVTDDQVPDWLDTSNPRVEVVSHRQIYRDRRWLPSFNSSGIETQLHHVKDLSEHFLYFNDDFFLGGVVTPEDFFLGNGAVRCFPSDQFANEKDIDEEREEYVVADKNAIELFKADFGGFGREIMLHVPYPSSRSLIERMEQRYQADFDRCASNPFRSMQDLRPIAFMQYHYGFRERMVVPSAISHRYLALWKPAIQEQLDNVLRTRRYKTFCINDVGIPPEREIAVNHAVKTFLEGYFPFKSSFEK